MEELLKVEHLVKTFGKNEVLKRASTDEKNEHSFLSS